MIKSYFPKMRHSILFCTHDIPLFWTYRAGSSGNFTRWLRFDKAVTSEYHILGGFFVFFVYWSWNTLKDKCTKKTSCAAIRKPALPSEAEGKAKKQTTEQWIINERSFMCHKQEPQYGTGRVIQTLTNTNIHLQIYIIPLPPTNCAMLFQTIKHAVLIFDALLVSHCRDPTSCFLLLCCWAVG